MTEKAKILIIDDVMVNIQILTDILEDHYKVISTTSGKEGIELAISDSPDLILLDIMMPGLNGYEVCKRLKKDSRTTNIPIIFITAMNEIEDERKGLELGAIDYITKPINPATVEIRIKNHLQLKKYYCDQKNCLNCSIGYAILKGE